MRQEWQEIEAERQKLRQIKRDEMAKLAEEKARDDAEFKERTRLLEERERNLENSRRALEEEKLRLEKRIQEENERAEKRRVMEEEFKKMEEERKVQANSSPLPPPSSLISHSPWDFNGMAIRR